MTGTRRSRSHETGQALWGTLCGVSVRLRKAMRDATEPVAAATEIQRSSSSAMLMGHLKDRLGIFKS